MNSAYRPLATKRLLLRQPELDHAPLIFEAFASDPEVTRFLRWRPHESVAESVANMELRLDRLRTGAECSWIPVLRQSGAVVGSVSFWPGGAEAELGFCWARSVWGNGLATEAGVAVLEWAFSAAGVARVWAGSDAENRASCRVLEKLGMSLERREPGFAVHPNLGSEPRDCLIYAVERAAAR